MLSLDKSGAMSMVEGDGTTIGSDVSTHWSTPNSMENVAKHNWLGGLAWALAI